MNAEVLHIGRDRGQGVTVEINGLNSRDVVGVLQEARVRHLVDLTPTLIEIVLAETEPERTAVRRRLAIVAEGIDFLRGSGDRSEVGVQLADLSSHVEDLKERAAQLFSGAEIPSGVSHLSRAETTRFAHGLWELRDEFWRKLYELPFVREEHSEVLQRVVNGEGGAMRALFLPRRYWSDGNRSTRDSVLRALCADVLTLAQEARRRGDKASEVSRIAVRVPFIPERALELMAEYKRRYECRGSLMSTGLPENDLGTFDREIRRCEARYVRVRNYLVMANVGWSASQVRSFSHRGQSGEDLQQAGVVGLLESIERFDPAVGFALSTNSEAWIRKEVINTSRIDASCIPVPRSKHSSFVKYRKAAGDADAIDALVASGALCAEDIPHFGRIDGAMQRLDAPLSAQTQGLSLGEVMADQKAPLVDAKLQDDDTRAAVEGLLVRIPRIDREIVVLAFGLLGNPQLNDAAIGERLNLSKDSVRSRKMRALFMLSRAAEGARGALLGVRDVDAEWK